jgi:hypothetical protein
MEIVVKQNYSAAQHINLIPISDIDYIIGEWNDVYWKFPQCALFCLQITFLRDHELPDA